MFIKQLYLNNLRNHIASELEFCDNLNIITGQNGAGKTTILEAISLCSVSKSFLPSPDSQLINNGFDFYQISANSINDIDVTYKISIKYLKGSRKQINSTLGDNLNPGDIIGEMPVVVLSPDYKSITFGPPIERRSFIDMLLCQTSKVYLEALYKFKKALKQRNNVLLIAKQNPNFDLAELEAWSEYFISAASEIVFKRNRFIQDFIPFFADVYKRIGNENEIVSVEYQPDSIENKIINSKNIQEIKEIFKDLSVKYEKDEIRRGTSLFGPQKDDLKININGGSAKDFASQGQHKSLLIALKFAEFEFLKIKRNETPIILLDDIFSELDADRRIKVLSILEETTAQAFITTTDAESFQNVLIKDKNRLFCVMNGKIENDN